MFPLMTPTDQEKWLSITRKVQRLSIDAPPNCSSRILKQICPIRDLYDTRNQFLFNDTLTFLTDDTYKNSFFSKIKPLQLRNTRQNSSSNYSIKKSHPKSAVTELANFIDNCNLKSPTDFESLYESNIPKTYIQEIDQNLPEKDKKIIQHLSLDVLSREWANKTNSEICELCTDCKIKLRPVFVTETTQHLIECSLEGKKIIDDLKPLVEEMIEYAHNRINSTSYSKIIQECKYFLNREIFSNEIDLLLGIGKIQQLKDMNKKLHLKLKTTIGKHQKTLIDILKTKNRLTIDYELKIHNLRSEQIKRVRTYL